MHVYSSVPEPQNAILSKGMSSFGIYFGSTSTSVALQREERCEVLSNETGSRTTPACVAFQEGETLVGLAAQQGQSRNETNTFVNIKQFLGKNFPEAEELVGKHPFSAEEVDGKVKFKVNWLGKQKYFSTVQLVKALFQGLRDTAMAGSGGTGQNLPAVITAPYYFSDIQKMELREAADSAGFKVLRIISEPGAAAFAYGLGQDDPTKNDSVLVFHLGGDSLDMTVIQVSVGMYQVLANTHVFGMGGQVIDTMVAEYLASEFHRTNRVDVSGNRKAMHKLRRAAEEAKRTLSTSKVANIYVDSLYDGMGFEHRLGKPKFESMCSPVLSKCIEAMKDVLKELDQPVNQVVLRGGSTRIPLLKKMILAALPGATILDGLAPDEVVAIGAARQCSLINEKAEFEEVSTPFKCTSHAIIAKVVGESDSGEDELVPLVPKYVPLPLKMSHCLLLTKAQQIIFHESESDRELKNERLLAEICTRDLKLDCSKPVTITCSITKNSKVSISATA